MPVVHVTAALTQLVDTEVGENVVKTVDNRGANPASVGTDPDLTFNASDVVAAGAREEFPLQPGARLFAICGAGLATDLSVEG